MGYRQDDRNMAHQRHDAGQTRRSGGWSWRKPMCKGSPRGGVVQSFRQENEVEVGKS